MKLKKWIEENEMSMANFARLLDSNRSHVEGLVSERHNPSIKTLYKIILITKGQVNVTDFLSDKDRNIEIEKITYFRIKKSKEASNAKN